MKIKAACLFIMMILMPVSTPITADQTHKSKYVGEENREIKSLSDADIDELENGKGWGLAKAAELNGMPGPAHLLEMKAEIDLSAKQVRAIETLYNQMKKEAIPLGHELISLERELNNHFATRTITDDLLVQLLGDISKIKQKLRLVHRKSMI